MDENSSSTTSLMTPTEQYDRITSESDEDATLLGDMIVGLENELDGAETSRNNCVKRERSSSRSDTDLEEILMKSRDSEQGTKQMVARQIGSPTYVSSEKDSSSENLSTKYGDSGSNEGSAVAGGVDGASHVKVKKFRKTKSSIGDDDGSSAESEDGGLRCDVDGTNNGECLQESKMEKAIRLFSPEDGSSGYDTGSSGTEETDILRRKPSHSLRTLGKRTLNNIFEEQTFTQDEMANEIEHKPTEVGSNEKSSEPIELLKFRTCLHGSLSDKLDVCEYENSLKNKTHRLLVDVSLELQRLKDASDDQESIYSPKSFSYPEEAAVPHVDHSLGLDELEEAASDKEKEFTTRHCLRCSFNSDQLASDYENFREVGNGLVLKLAVVELEKLTSDNCEGPETVFVRKEFVYPDSEDEEETDPRVEDLSELLSSRRELHSSFERERVTSTIEDDRRIKNDLLLRQAGECLEELISDMGDGTEYVYERPDFEYTDSEDENYLAEADVSEEIEKDGKVLPQMAVGFPPALDMHQPPVSSLRLHDSFDSEDLRKEYEEYSKINNEGFQMFAALKLGPTYAGEEPRSLCNRKEFNCPKSKRESEPKQLHTTKDLEVVSLPRVSRHRHRTNVKYEELREEDDEYEKIKNECIQILADLDLKSTAAGEGTWSLCDRKDFNNLRPKREQGLQLLQTDEEFVVFRPQPSYDCRYGTLEAEKFSEEYEECKQMKNKCILILEDLDLKSADAGIETARDKKELHFPQLIEEKRLHQLQRTEEPNILQRSSSLHWQQGSFESKKLSSIHEDEKTSDNSGDNRYTALELEKPSSDPIEEPTSAYITKEEECPDAGDEEGVEPAIDEELEVYWPHAYRRHHRVSLGSEELRKEHEEIKRLKNECILILEELDLKSTDAGKLTGSLLDLKEFKYSNSRRDQGQQQLQTTEEPDQKHHFSSLHCLHGSFETELLVKEYEDFKKSENEIIQRMAFLDPEKSSSDAIEEKESGCQDVHQPQSAADACDKFDKFPFRRHCLHGSFEMADLVTRYEVYRKVENEAVKRLVELELGKWITNESGGGPTLLYDMNEFECPYSKEDEELEPPIKDEGPCTVSQFGSRCCLHTSFESGELASAYEDYRTLVNEDVHRRASLEILRSTSIESEESVCVHFRKGFAYPNTDDEDEPLPSSLESFLLPFRTCLNASFESDELSQQYESFRTIENNRLMNLVCQTLENTAVVEESDKCDSFDVKENVSTIALDTEHSMLMNDCSNSFSAAKGFRDCSLITVVPTSECSLKRHSEQEENCAEKAHETCQPATSFVLDSEAVQRSATREEYRAPERK